MSRRRQKAIQSFIQEEDLSKIKNVLNYLFFDQYRDIASFPRFEECLSFLTNGKNIFPMQCMSIFTVLQR